jgi:hypothetical protein
MLSNHSMFISSPRHGLAFLPTYFYGLCGAQGMVERTSIVVSHLLQSQKSNPRRKSNYTIIRSSCAHVWI